MDINSIEFLKTLPKYSNAMLGNDLSQCDASAGAAIDITAKGSPLLCAIKYYNLRSLRDILKRIAYHKIITFL